MAGGKRAVLAAACMLMAASAGLTGCQSCPPPAPTVEMYIPADAQGDLVANRRTQMTLEEEVSFDFIATPLVDVVAFLRNLKRINIVIDRRALANAGEMDLTLRLDRVTFRDALHWICRLLDVRYTILEGAIWISSEKRLEALRQAPKAVRVDSTDAPVLQALGEPVSFDFIATPLDDVVAFLRNLKKVNIIVDKKALAERKDGDSDITLRLDGVKFGDALAWICRLQGLWYEVSDKVIFISTEDKFGIGSGK